ncbi:uncharacterized protein LOC116367787 isoform X3 [Oncorhynchus kisutch]|uniref:uncharacterized protein LOC116367787 isoform X3 n=1 Tax=Oncorhynchus kisutch TaxID=8019 RepID=UPI0012DC5E96|nr:uncharacterized protein LOC116367787 isoform X3 [Oncorhynchus kisutch]
MQLVSMCGNIFRLSLLLLLLGQCSAVEVTQNKILETRGADATLLCSKQTLTDISTVVCHKNRVISGGHECRVSHDVETNHTNSSCDPRVTLQIENDRVCLHITNIQPSDEGNYTCQCGYNGGRDYIDIHISVNEHSYKCLETSRRRSNGTLSPTAHSQGKPMGFTQLSSCLTPDPDPLALLTNDDMVLDTFL